ncbi:unnamed protein product [Phytophthora lilii]|uniref:Unnamed protein product n=1 Tax=Phytophthora lilii TaxID=2077276 RepID=A0A9W6TKN8_9STRA|nr:unnamed protein product [Phytophthora lilii]
MPPFPSVPAQADTHTHGNGRDSGVDYVLLDLTNSIEENHARQKTATPILPLPCATKPDYIARRIECWSNGYVSEELLDVSTSLPLGPQAAFRRKLLIVLALQLLAVWFAVGLATFYPPVHDRVIPIFAEHSPVLLVVSAALTFMLLGILYFQRNRRYLNILILLWFSAAQAATFVGLGVMFDTHIGFFNCGATFAWVLIMMMLAGIRLKDDPIDGLPIPVRHLMSPLVAGALSYAAVVSISCVLFMIYGARFVTDAAFGYSLIFQFTLLAWFTWDLTCMFEVVAVDEFAHGAIYIYTDIVLSLLLSVAAAGAAIGFTSLMVLMLATGADDPGCCCEADIYCCLICLDCDCDRRSDRRARPARAERRSRPTQGIRRQNTTEHNRGVRNDERMERV